MFILQIYSIEYYQSLSDFSEYSFLPDLHTEAVSLLVCLYYISEICSSSLSLSCPHPFVSLSLDVCTRQSHWPPVIFGEVVEDVHFIIVLQKAVRSTDMVALQHWAVIVQDGCVWSEREGAIMSHRSDKQDVSSWSLLLNANLFLDFSCNYDLKGHTSF